MASIFMLRETFPEVKHSDARVVVSPVPPLPTTIVHSSPRGLILACINKLANSPYKRAGLQPRGGPARVN